MLFAVIRRGRSPVRAERFQLEKVLHVPSRSRSGSHIIKRTESQRLRKSSIN